MFEWIDWSLLATLPVWFGLSGGGGQQKTQTDFVDDSTVERGLPEKQAKSLSEFLEPRLRTSYMPLLRGRLENPSFQMPSLTPEGIFSTQTPSFTNLLNQGVSRASGNLAQRGFLSPRNAPFVAGQAVQDIAPQFLSGVGQNIEQAVLEPEAQRRRDVANYLAAWEQLTSLLGGQSAQSRTTTSTTSGGGSQFGFGDALAAAAITAAATASGDPTGGAAFNELFATGMAASDRRLKSHIRRVGTHRLGIGIYEYVIGGQQARGVMADEVAQVKPEAVARRADGYWMVNYDLL